MAGSAVATMVWSSAARNIGSMTDGNTVRNSDPPAGMARAGAAAIGSAGSDSLDVIGMGGKLLCAAASAIRRRMRWAAGQADGPPLPDVRLDAESRIGVRVGRSVPTSWRAQARHPRLSGLRARKPWMAGLRPP